LNPRADIHAHRILILDFGSQYTPLIARRVREIGVYCKIHLYDMDEQDLGAFKPKGVPASTIEGVYGFTRLLDRISAA